MNRHKIWGLGCGAFTHGVADFDATLRGFTQFGAALGEDGPTSARKGARGVS